MTGAATPTSQDRGTEQVTQILLPQVHYDAVVGHAIRKLSGEYAAGETPERKAFGMLAGRVRAGTIEVTGVAPLRVNLRRDESYAAEMDEIVDAYAIPSETPNDQRGWIAHPAELLAIERACDTRDWLMFGNYHTHRVAWPQDPLRDTCTKLDRRFAADSGQWTFIVSAVDLRRPLLRAFYEADNEREAVIRVVPGAAAADAPGLLLDQKGRCDNR